MKSINDTLKDFQLRKFHFKIEKLHDKNSSLSLLKI